MWERSKDVNWSSMCSPPGLLSKRVILTRQCRAVVHYGRMEDPWPCLHRARLLLLVGEPGCAVLGFDLVTLYNASSSCTEPPSSLSTALLQPIFMPFRQSFSGSKQLASRPRNPQQGHQDDQADAKRHACILRDFPTQGNSRLLVSVRGG